MDRRPPPISVPSCPSLLKHATSHSTPLSPLTPPRRLHQRSLLPSPPISPHLIKPAPPTPYPWIWRCHICHSVYRLGVTRRCLEDGHYFCSLPSPPPTPTPPPNPDPDQKKKNKKKKRHRPPRGCRAEFDYAGWETHNQWRREISALKSQSQSQSQSHTLHNHNHNHNPRALLAPLKTGKDCYHDCDYPSECQTRYGPASGAPPPTRKKSEPELICAPISPISPGRERQRREDEREDQQLIFDIAATTPPATTTTTTPTTRTLQEPKIISSSLTPAISSPNLSVLVERERRKSLEAEKRGLEHEAQFIVSPLTSHTAFTDINYGGGGASSPPLSLSLQKGKEREKGKKECDTAKRDRLGVSYPTELDHLAGEEEEEETEEDEKGYVREFIRVKRRKSIAKIEQLTGLRLSEVQYGKMEGEVVDGDVGGAGQGEGEGRAGRRASVEIESPPSSPLKMFSTVEDSDDEGDLDKVTPWYKQKRLHSY
ncbi:hypothetical protein DSL72_005250 [Monilinia vaccinii-corymbosi]|uniref:Uncharacterized protein n=1 Tax=Monilinia vaccinii-corymbosi TaxID=61207 RepID=A0A8A3PF35_9HELO|nr:hypothetical protein DSL72_005250 [Monilinia vaccinii-corymbosi]